MADKKLRVVNPGSRGLQWRLDEVLADVAEHARQSGCPDSHIDYIESVRRELLPQYSHRDIVISLREYANTLGRTPTKVDLRKPDRAGCPSTQTLVRYFGSLPAAMQAAGLRPNMPGQQRHRISNTRPYLGAERTGGATP